MRVPSPNAIWRAIRLIPRIGYFAAGIHGDLNIRNVFIRWHSTDAILIDFSHSGAKESLARDPSKLETSIALNATDARNRLLSLGKLSGIYRSPLLPPRAIRTIDGRTEAIRQIRCQAGGEGIPNPEYQVLAACHLLKFAVEPAEAQDDNELLRPRRAASYWLACNLISAAHIELKSQTKP